MIIHASRYLKTSRIVFLIGWVVAAFFLSSPLWGQGAGGDRVALVIGNGAYEHVPELKNPKNDSEDLANALTAVGFEVLLHTDQSQGSMLDTLRGFRRKAARAEIALIYFAGHGIEIDRQNYLIPVDAVLETDSDINFEAVPLDTMIFAASGASRLSMVIVDACRNNPFAASIQRTNASRSIGRGLSAVEPTKNTLVAYAAKEGTTAADGAGRNSPYAEALIKALNEPNLEVGLMMRRVRDQVLDTTSGQQEPFVYGSLSAEQIFLNDTRGLSLVAPKPETPQTQGASAAEIAFWQSIAETSDPAELESYLARYPNGLFSVLAEARVARLRNAEPGPKDAFKPLVPQVDPDVAEPTQPEPSRALTRREVIELQERLSALGHSLGRADGIPGRRTATAVRAFERSQDLPETGEASLPVLAALRDKVTDADLEDWRSKQRAARVVKPKAQPTQPRAEPTEPATEEPKTSTVNSGAFRQFCASNKQCATSQCRTSDGSGFRKRKNCQFCNVYAIRCE